MMKFKKPAQLPRGKRAAGLTPLQNTGPIEFHPDTRQPIYLLTEPFAEFRGLSHKHHHALEHDLVKDDPDSAFPIDEFNLGDMH
jgi:hypothetical protein